MSLEQFILVMALRNPEAYSVSKIEDGNYCMGKIHTICVCQVNIYWVIATTDLWFASVQRGNLAAFWKESFMSNITVKNLQVLFS